MKRLIIIAITIATVLMTAACKEDPYNPVTKHESVVFSLVGEVPIVAYPEDNVHYSLTLSYSAGLSSASVYLDGVKIEGSEVTFDGSPKEASYSFGYTLQAEHVGQSVNFVFTAVCADGYVGKIDYPVYVKSISEDIKVTIPEGAPDMTVVGETVEFDVNVETGYNISRIKTLKNDVEITSLTKTSGFTKPKMDTYHFSYTAALGDKAKNLKFVIECVDVKGNFGSAEYYLRVSKGEPKDLIREIFDTEMSVSNTTAFNTTAGGVSGTTATEFKPGNISRYGGNDPAVTNGVKQGLTIYDGDKSAVSYEGDGTNICLSKYDYSTMSLISGTYVWARKAKNGWITISGIKLHDCTDLTLKYLQCGGSVKVQYSINGEDWTDVCATSTTAEQTAAFSVPEGTDRIQLKFIENNGGAHLRFDNISIVGE